MIRYTLFSAIVLLLLLSGCSMNDAVTTQPNGLYSGTMAFEWERVDVKNFATAPDSMYYSGAYTQEFQVRFDGDIFTLPEYEILVSSTLLIEPDSISFGIIEVACEFVSDCGWILSGEKAA